MGLRYSFLYFTIWNAQYLLSAERISDSTVHKFLGDSVIFPLSSESENISDVTLRKNGVYLFRWNRGDVNQGYVSRLTFLGNRTLTLDRLEERDAGSYEMELFDMAGTLTHKATITIILTCLQGFHEVHGDLGAPVDVFRVNLTGLSWPSDAKWEKNGLVVAQLNRSVPVYSEKPEARVEMWPTGECRLVRVHISDAGNHTLEVPHGNLRLRWSARLVVRVPEPFIEHACLSDGRAEYRCLTKWRIPTLWMLKGGSLGDGDSESGLVLSSFTGELLCMLKEYPEQNASVSFTCTSPYAANTTYILAVCCTLGIVMILSLAGLYICLKRRRPQDQSRQLPTMVPQEVIRVCELTDMDTFPPLRHSLLEEEKIYSCISQPAEMSTFF